MERDVFFRKHRGFRLADASVEAFVRDVQSALTFLESAGGMDPNRIGICGSSLGGTAALAAAASDRRIKALVLRSAPTAGYHHLTEKVTIPALVVQGDADPLLEESQGWMRRLEGEKRHRLVVSGETVDVPR
jgi:dienelactone hydrolase